ncbi:TRNA/rRNA methyltransferase [Mucinivorans hirudinis]|uniref:tRNA/rRNA methyltransferase n=1 Tax=Mucinivorans hirudinis TaxID=1433126 RepID=A0A060R7N9_9BACT|nr:TRNA/rRNA methyltransferase [Mucinivorans hirudinis]
MLKITNQELGRMSPAEFSAASKLPIVAVLDNVRSANNVGSFFRTADAFGISELVLCGISATPPSKDIHKTALGAEQTVGWRYFENTGRAIETLKQEGYTIIAIEQVRGAVSLDKFVRGEDKKYALVFGNEVEGVAQEIVDMCDSAIEIPQRGTKHSLNVSVSGGIILWHFTFL